MSGDRGENRGTGLAANPGASVGVGDGLGRGGFRELQTSGIRSASIEDIRTSYVYIV